eukprot:1157859-Pelagomonas_calceolata.AAC.2
MSHCLYWTLLNWRRASTCSVACDAHTAPHRAEFTYQHATSKLFKQAGFLRKLPAMAPTAPPCHDAEWALASERMPLIDAEIQKSNAGGQPAQILCSMLHRAKLYAICTPCLHGRSLSSF